LVRLLTISAGRPVRLQRRLFNWKVKYGKAHYLEMGVGGVGEPVFPPALPSRMENTRR